VYAPPDVVERYTLYPTTVDEVLAVQDKPTVGVAGAATPVPLSGIVILPLVAVLAIATLPEYDVAEAGVNVTASVAVWPAARTVPFEMPESVNPVPERPTLEMVTLEFPVLVNVTFCVPVLPTVTLPKDRLEALALS
jgi:hypothetical protein